MAVVFVLGDTDRGEIRPVSFPLKLGLPLAGEYFWGEFVFSSDNIRRRRGAGATGAANLKAPSVLLWLSCEQPSWDNVAESWEEDRERCPRNSKQTPLSCNIYHK